MTLKGEGSGPLPPLLQQYVEVRDAYPEYLLLFQVGDFYETFGEDAERFARALGLVLTHKTSKEFVTPMAGVPMRAVDAHLERLLKLGFRVAVADQVEHPDEADGLVRREVTQLLTPGTVTLENLLRPEANYLAALSTGDGYGLALLDVSTGEFRGVVLYGKNSVYDELFRYRPAEVLLAPELYQNLEFLNEFQRRFPVMLTEGRFELEAAQALLSKQLGQHTLEHPALLRSAGAILGYALETQRGQAHPNQNGFLPQVREFVRYDPSAFMQMSESTLRALEVFEPSSVGERSEDRTLMGILGLTRTAPGRRLLRAWLRHPLVDAAPLNARLDAVESLVRDGVLRGEVRKVLYKMHDLERLATRLMASRATARELVALQRSLALLPELAALLRGFAPLSALSERVPNLLEVAEQISSALVPEPPLKITEGGLIKEGFDSELDSLRAQGERGRQWIAGLEAEARERSQISSLKVGYNAVFGYYLEATRPHYDQVPKDWRAVQTLKDRMRFTTPELKEQERIILQAESEATKREYAVFLGLREAISGHAETIRQAAQALAELDVYAALAEAAVEYGYARPRFESQKPFIPTDASNLRSASLLPEGEAINIADKNPSPSGRAQRSGGFEPAQRSIRAGVRGSSGGEGQLTICSGRHPVVERHAEFIPNDLVMDLRSRLMLLTGPNMAGKSTYLRQIALIALLAQIGSFVPAESAQLPLFDRIYTRIGASDDIAGGRSTFMVEMDELASILHNATSHSLVLLDEIGRGTSTYDGLSLAWAACEHLHNITGAYTLFATHYFELTVLPNHLPAARNFHVAAREEAAGLVFYHQVLPGPANKSYGLEVAKLAGIPKAVWSRAQAILAGLEAQGDTGGQTVLDELLNLDTTRLTPLEALLKLQALREQLQKTVIEDV